MLHGRHDRKIEERSRATTAAILSDRRALSKATANSLRQIVWRSPEQCSVVVRDLVEERIAQAVGVRIPLAGPLVGGQRGFPERVGAVAAVHRQVEAV